VSAADLLALFGVGIAAGIVSVAASLASIVSYPALLALGLPPVSANVTNTVGPDVHRPRRRGRLAARAGRPAPAGRAPGPA